MGHQIELRRKPCRSGERRDCKLDLVDDFTRVESLVNEVNANARYTCSIVDFPESRRHTPIVRQQAFVDVQRPVFGYTKELFSQYWGVDCDAKPGIESANGLNSVLVAKGLNQKQFGVGM